MNGDVIAEIARRAAWPGETPGAPDAEQPMRSGRNGTAALPAWVGCVGAWVELARKRGLELPAPCARPGEPLPFEEVLLPVVESARSRLEARLDLRDTVFTSDALADLERGLLRWLCELCGPTLLHEFSLYRLTRQSGLDRIGSRAGTRCLYEAFRDDLLGGDLLLLFGEYASLGRLLAVVADRWVDMVAELGARAAADRDALGAAFAPRADPGRIAAVHWLSMDRHDGGRVILAVAFESGLRVVYKPRPVTLEERFGRLVRWLGRRGRLEPRLRVPAVLARGAYGWMEEVRYAPCPDRDAASRFYRRAGSLLALAHALGGVDLHMENLIACGEEPVPVDLESLMYPRALPAACSDPTGSDPSAQGGLSDSVLATDLLPRPDDARPFACSGLVGGSGFDSASVQGRLWHAVNTDAMSLREGPVPRRVPENLPSHDQVRFAPAEFESQVVEGFSAAYRDLVEVRSRLLVPGGPWRAFAGQPVRFVPRPTHVYGWIDRKGRQPECLIRGVDRDAELDVLEKASSSWDPRRRAHLERLVASERRALREWDIPCFRTHTDSRDLPLAGDGVLRDFFIESGYDRATRRLLCMDEDDLAVQVRLITQALAGASELR